MRLQAIQSSFRRLFSSKQSPSAAPTEDLFEKITVKIEKKSGLKDWMREMQERLSAQPSGPVWLGGPQRPFVHNPAFIAKPPITEALKQRIFELSEADPDHWKPRKLSAQFKVAIPRIKAIIKMKTLESQMIADGRLKPDEDYVKKMEEHLGARTPLKMEEEPVLDNSISNHLRPMFVATPETAPPLTFNDAAKLLNRPVTKDNSENTGEAEIEGESSSSPTTSAHNKFIRFDPYEKSRSKFIFVDMSEDARPRSRTLLVREPNGDLRTGSKPERLMVARKVWGKSAKHFMA